MEKMQARRVLLCVRESTDVGMRASVYWQNVTLGQSAGLGWSRLGLAGLSHEASLCSLSSR